MRAFIKCEFSELSMSTQEQTQIHKNCELSNPNCLMCAT
jgi:hypothetical protein